MLKYAVAMALPDDKSPGFYGQIVRSLAAKCKLFDRDKELLIVDNKEEIQAVKAVMARFRIACDVIRLCHLPASASLARNWTDYGFESRAGNRYLYSEQVSRCTISPQEGVQAEIKWALEQLKEHLIASWPEADTQIYACDSALMELAEGTARAYGCRISWLAPET